MWLCVLPNVCMTLILFLCVCVCQWTCISRKEGRSKAIMPSFWETINSHLRQSQLAPCLHKPWKNDFLINHCFGTMSGLSERAPAFFLSALFHLYSYMCSLVLLDLNPWPCQHALVTVPGENRISPAEQWAVLWGMCVCVGGWQQRERESERLSLCLRAVTTTLAGPLWLPGKFIS